jgi:hypothetical protein
LCTDGLCSYIRAMRETFRDPGRTGTGSSTLNRGMVRLQ